VLGTSPPTLSAGNLLLGSGISAGTTIVSPLPAPHYSISSSYTAISAEEMTTSAGEILVGSITGTVATFTSGSGISGQVLTSSNVQLLPNTYLTTSGASGTVGVYQTVGSPPLPNGNPAESVGITAVSTAGTNAAVFGGYITSGTGSSTLSIVTFAAGTTLTTGQTLLVDKIQHLSPI
jgi:hypothetical protein